MEQNVVKRTFIGMVEAGEKLMRQALEATGSSAEEVERLRQIAESQFRAVSEYQLNALGYQSRRPH